MRVSGCHPEIQHRRHAGAEVGYDPGHGVRLLVRAGQLVIEVGAAVDEVRLGHACGVDHLGVQAVCAVLWLAMLRIPASTASMS